MLARDPGNLPATVGLADLFGRAGEVEAAISLFETAVGTHPRSAVLWCTYGDFLVSLGRCADAIESFKRAEKIDPTSAETQARLAIAYRGLAQLDDALTYFDWAQEFVAIQLAHPSGAGNRCNWPAVNSPMAGGSSTGATRRTRPGPIFSRNGTARR